MTSYVLKKIGYELVGFFVNVLLIINLILLVLSSWTYIVYTGSATTQLEALLMASEQFSPLSFILHSFRGAQNTAF